MKEFDLDYIGGPKNKVISIQRYQDEVHSRIPSAKLRVLEYNHPKNALLAALARLAYTLKVAFSVREKTVKHIIWFEFAYLLFLPRMKKSVVTVYDTIPFERWGDFGAFAKFRAWINSIAIRRADRIITISDYSAKEIRRVLGVEKGRISVVKPGLDTAHFKPEKKDPKAWGAKSGPVILMVGAEDPRQNVDKIIDAVSILKEEFPGIVFLKAGKPVFKGARERLLAQVERLRLNGRVRFLGFVPEEKLPSLYSSADVFVYPCSSAGWGLPPSEAMACGTPVVTSNIGPLPEVVGNCAIKVNPEVPKEIADAIRRVLRSPRLRKKMSKEGREYAKQFSWEKAAGETEAVYRSLL